MEVPAPWTELGFKETVWTPLFPEFDKVIVESKPSETVLVIVTVPVPPLETVIEVGDALMAKLGVALVTFRVTDAVLVVPPAAPVTVILYVPTTVVEDTLIVITEVPAPVIEAGLKTTETPVGWPVAEREIAELKPPVTALVIVEVPALPCVTETVAGEAERLKPEAGEPPASAATRAAPFGLPIPVAKS